MQHAFNHASMARRGGPSKVALARIGTVRLLFTRQINNRAEPYQPVPARFWGVV